MTLDDQAAAVQTQEDLKTFVSRLKDDLAARPGEWQNLDLSSFLEAMSAWLHDMDVEGYYRRMGLELAKLPPWRVFADILMAARIYE